MTINLYMHPGVMAVLAAVLLFVLIKTLVELIP